MAPLPATPTQSACQARPRGGRGFTLIEMLATLAILGVLAGIALPKATLAMNQAKIVRAIGDIKAIQTDLQAIEAGDQPLPADLSAIGRGSMLDPWGRPYQYLRFPPPPPPAPGAARKDKFLVPINSTFDLYSLGADGASSPPLTANDSRDDIVRANDGGFIGLATKY